MSANRLDEAISEKVELQRVNERLREQSYRWSEANQKVVHRTLGYMEACGEGLPVEALDRKRDLVFEATELPAVIEMMRRKPDGTPLPQDERLGEVGSRS